MFKLDEAACLLAERFNMIGWIYKQEPIMFNRLASYFADLNAPNDKTALSNVATAHSEQLSERSHPIYKPRERN